MSLPDVAAPPPGSANEPPPLPKKPSHLRRPSVPSSPRGAEAWRADARRARQAPAAPTPAPPPLPPKPAHARAADIPENNGAPPLPPKPTYARAAEVADIVPTTPTRPTSKNQGQPPALPLPPAHSHVDAHADDDANAQPPSELAPPERSIISAALTVPLDPQAFVQPDISDDGLPDPDDIPAHLELPLPPPLCALTHAALEHAYGDAALPLRKRDVLALAPHNVADVRAAATEIARRRARNPRSPRERGRAQRRNNDIRSAREERIVCAPFRPAPPPPETQDVLDAVLSAYGTPLHDSQTQPEAHAQVHGEVNETSGERALLVFVGIVIKATLHEQQCGRHLLADAVGALLARDAAHHALTIIFNVSAQACFARDEAHIDAIQLLARNTFADLVLAMRNEQRCKVWEAAARCAGVLYADNVIPDSVERQALLSCASHLAPNGMPAVVRLLFNIVQRASPHDVRTADHFFPDVASTVGVYAYTESQATRNLLFRALLRAAFDAASAGAQLEPDVNVEQQLDWLLAVLEANGAPDALALAFRVGADDKLVIWLVSQLLFAPLQRDDHDIVAMPDDEHDDEVSSRWGRSAGPPSDTGPLGAASGARRDTAARALQVSARRHARAVRTAARVLHRPLVLRVLRALAALARAAAHSRPQPVDAADAAVRTAERAAAALRYSAPRRAHAVGALRALHDAAAALPGTPRAAYAATRIAELLLAAVCVRPAFARPAPAGPDTVAEQFLAGQLLALRAVIADVDVALLLALLTLTEPLWSDPHVSACRQAVVELTGAAPDRAALLAPWTRDDPDPAVAYRASIVYNTHCEDASDEEQVPEGYAHHGIVHNPAAAHDAYAKALLFKASAPAPFATPTR